MPQKECIRAKDLGLELSWNGSLLAGVRLGWSRDMAASSRPSARALWLRERLERYVAGQDPSWWDPDQGPDQGLKLDLDGLRPFLRNVLMALRDNAGFGQTLTYGQLAELAGRPGAARAVGQAMRRNPWPLIVPCHRVIGADGSLTGFSGPGLEMKEYLLCLEGARFA